MADLKCGAVLCPTHFQLVKRHVLGVFRITMVMTTESGSHWHVVIPIR